MTPTRPPGLGPHVVGRRVVVRRLVRGESGPTGGPAFTDVLGVMERWSADTAEVRTESGALVRIAVADIVSGKPVPPRASPRQRISASAAERRALASWPARVVEPLGEWVLRASDGYSARANSVLADGDPGTTFEDALARVRAFYASHDLPAWAQVVVGSPVHRALEEARWQVARPGEDDTLFQLAPVASVVRTLRRSLPEDPPAVDLAPTASPAWLADEERSVAAGDAALAVLEGPPHVAFASVSDPGSGTVVAKGRVALGGGTVPGDQDWAGISNVWVAPDARRRRLGMVVMAAMVGWAAEHGATTVYLQVRGDNPPALAAYERLGFATHHAYRYLTPPR